MTLYVRRSSPKNPTGVPNAPAAPAVSAGNTQLTATWTAPTTDGGSPVTSYDLRHSVQAANTWTTITGVTSPRIVTGLVNGTTYEIQVRAVNAIGPSAWSTSGTGIPAVSAFAVRSVTVASSPSGTAVNVPAGAVAGDTLIFIASFASDIAGTMVAPSGSTQIGTTPTGAAGYGLIAAWRILSWNGSTNSYDFGHPGDGFAGERLIVCMQGTASAVTGGTHTLSNGTNPTWTGMTMATGDVAIANMGIYNPAQLPVTDFDGTYTVRMTNGGKWAGLSSWSKAIATGGTIAPSPGGTKPTGNNVTLMLRVQP